MASKKKTAKKADGKKNKEIDELRALLETLHSEVSAMQQTIKKQNKRITSLESDNKRFSKTLRKLQTGGLSASALHNGDADGGGGADDDNDTLLSPAKIAPSSTSMSSISASDIESSDAETERKEDDTDVPRKTKKNGGSGDKKRVIARRNKSKPQKKASDIKWTFDLAHKKIKAGDNGQSVLKPKTASGTIRFGRLVHFSKNNPDNLSSFTIIFEASAGSNSTLGFGFATQSFVQWDGSNFGENNSCIIKGNAQFVGSENVFTFVDGKTYAHKSMIETLKVNAKDGFFVEREKVAVSVNFEQNIGKIWNESKNEGAADNEKVFEIKLPEKDEICLVVYMAGSGKKKLNVEGQKFEFKE